MSLVTFLILGAVAVLLVAVNFGLQRVVRPDKGDDTVAGCCGMALPNELAESQLKENEELK